MLRGSKVGLQARHAVDVAILHAELYDDVATRSRAGSRAWRPIPVGHRCSSQKAHLGVSLRPAFRGRGLGADVVRVLCQYGFVVRGPHRLQIETLSDNTAMIASATRSGLSTRARYAVPHG
jgi:hypothetical protein